MAFDLDKVIAENDNREPFTFTFDGKTYKLPNDLDVKVIDLARDGALGPALELLLGDEQWESLNASSQVLGAKAVGALIDAYFEDLGVGDMGESSASTRSSNRAERRSKPTSNAGTTSGSPT